MIYRMLISFFMFCNIHISYAYADSGNDKLKACLVKQDCVFCECIIMVSNSINDNDAILDIFLNSYDTEAAIKMTEDLINGDSYTYYKFPSRKDKSEFVRGKIALFSSEIRRNCK